MNIPIMPVEQFECQQRRQDSADGQLWALLDEVKDPEIPVLSIWELGVLRDVQSVGETVIVTVTPTYSGCPAMDQITDDIRTLLVDAGHADVQVQTRLAPAWSSQWMSAEGRKKLHLYGVAPPASTDSPTCPLCGSEQVKPISEFGSTACKALYTCKDCDEPFDYFKRF